MNSDVQAFFEQFDHRRALASIARAVRLRERGELRAWVIVWPSIPPLPWYAAVGCAPADLHQCAA